MAGVLVFGDIAGGELTAASLEAVAAGAAVSRALSEPLQGALIGDNLAAAAEAFRYAIPSAYLVEGGQYRQYLAQERVAAAEAVIKACSPAVVLFTHTLATREWVPQLAARLDAGLVMDCTALGVEGDTLIATKPVYGGGVLGEFVMRGPLRLVTIRLGAFRPEPAASTGEIHRIDPPAPGRTHITFVGEATAAIGGGPTLKDAKIVVAGGRGLGAAENWHYIDEVALLLGAAVGCSRPVADSGWVSTSCQVGLSGTCVAPDLYIAIGISGAVQHLAGISAAKTVVAINPDSGAEILARADLGVLGDYREVLPAFAQRVKELRS
jgi:electron transfer flavoprotein alpha subunit